MGVVSVKDKRQRKQRQGDPPNLAAGLTPVEERGKEGGLGSSCCSAAEMNLTGIHEDMGSIPGLAQWVKDLALP